MEGPDILKGEMKSDRTNLKRNKTAEPEYFLVDKNYRIHE